MAPFIPKYVVMSCAGNEKYVRYIDKPDTVVNQILRAEEKYATSPYAKFAIEKAKSSSDLVHIRCCYNNKYWRRHDNTEKLEYLSAAADKTDEDKSKWSCTLFKPIQTSDGSNSFRFQHVQTGNYVIYVSFFGCLAVNENPVNDYSRFIITNWESLVILPTHVVFKGDNGKYLQYRLKDGDDRMDFTSDDIGARNVPHEAAVNTDGSIRLKLDYNGKFWQGDTKNFICPTSGDGPFKISFRPVKLAAEGNKANIVALKYLGNDRFCRRTTLDGQVDCLVAPSSATTIEKEAHFQVEEPIVSRRVYDVSFRLGNARIYDQEILALATDETFNKSDTATASNLTLEYTDTRTSSYKNSTSVKTGGEISFSATIPIIEGILDIGLSSSYSMEYGNSYSWGDTKTKTSKISNIIKAVVPPKTKVTVTLAATTGVCDVPFSYMQRDTFSNGKTVTYFKDDGLYSGTNYFGFNFVVKEEPIAV